MLLDPVLPCLRRGFESSGAFEVGEEGAGGLQVGGVEAFGEPGVNRGEQGDRLLRPALLAARLIAARNSQDFAFCRRATSMAVSMAVSASLIVPAPTSSASPLSR
jgi:hypothetical protein